MSRGKRQDQGTGVDAKGPQKKQKADDSGGRILLEKKKADGMIVAEATATAPNDNDVTAPHVKSKKELRKDKKALKAAANEPIRVATEEEEKVEKIRLQKERRKEFRKEQSLETEKKIKQESKMRQEKKRQRVLNAPGGAKRAQARKASRKENEATNAQGENNKQVTPLNEKKSQQEHDLDIFKNLYGASSDGATGYTTLRLGLKYKDTVVGKGPTPVKDLMLVTVSYKLRAGQFGAVLDSSKKFNFRVGKGEVIQGWDIGVIGMRQGGTRHLIVPPKAGYGAQDIGGGAGAILYFDITILSC
jgi:FKBP-type peptidyl-prolyl cis-trans isomerase